MSVSFESQHSLPPDFAALRLALSRGRGERHWRLTAGAELSRIIFMNIAPDTLYSINGKIVPESEALLPVTDRGFLYGDGLFETLHAYGQVLFRADAHFARLLAGATTLYFDPLPDIKKLAEWLRDIVATAAFPEANVRLTVTRGCGPRGPSLRGSFSSNVVITVTRHVRPPDSVFLAGVSAVIASLRRQESAATAMLKTLNYIEQILAKREADLAGASEALLLNNAGLLCEGSASNISIVRDGKLAIPDPKLSGRCRESRNSLPLKPRRIWGLKRFTPA